ncbi:TSUP family transporter [Peredibacter sp. HCB2-198]|uniref:TSUP family transporter n=1 Tax=Peredibacter sp. HCB2-198 TaxID=3383025 RepID=UPI0038B56F87
MMIGLTVGLIMGLTGAGGALISIPLLIGLLGLTLKKATILSLAIVIISTLINLIGVRPRLNLRLILILAAGGGIGNVLTLPLKNLVPDYFVAVLIIAIAIYSLIGVWNERYEIGKINLRQSLVKSIIIGLTLGMITTLTGLGGGVLLMPILIRFYGMNYQEALGNGLASILLVSIMSFIFQWQEAKDIVTPTEFTLIILGSIASVILIRKIPAKFLRTRKIVFTLVVAYSTVSIMRSVWI